MGVGACRCSMHAAAAALQHRGVSLPQHCLSADTAGLKIRTVRRTRTECGRTLAVCSTASAGGGAAAAERGAARRVLGFVERQFLPLGLLASLLIG